MTNNTNLNDINFNKMITIIGNKLSGKNFFLNLFLDKSLIKKRYLELPEKERLLKD